MENTNIHPTAVVDSQATLAQGVNIGPYAVIEGGVALGENVQVGSHCVVCGNTTIGKGCKIYSGAVVGSAPQDKKHSADDNVFLRIGENNTIREFVTINPGTVEGGGETVIGNNNLIMAYSHIAHDCRIGNYCVMANAATLGGHVILEDRAVIGGMTAVHQFVRLGRLCMVGGCSKVVQDIPPFSMCDGHPAKVVRTNVVGLKRAGIPAEEQLHLKRAFKILFSSGLTNAHAVEKVIKDIPGGEYVDHLISFIKTSERGVCR